MNLQLGNIRAEMKYAGDGVKFKSAFANFSLYFNSLGAEPIAAEIVQVCYGAVFAASVRNIKGRRVPFGKRWKKP